MHVQAGWQARWRSCCPGAWWWRFVFRAVGQAQAAVGQWPEAPGVWPEAQGFAGAAGPGGGRREGEREGGREG